MKKKSFLSAKNVTTLAVLLALVIVLQGLGGVFSIGVVTLNFTLIPLVLGAILLGPYAGAFLGAVSGAVVLGQVITAPVDPAGFYYLIWTNSPVVTTLICLVKTTVAGFVAGIIFDLLKKKKRRVAIFVASGIVPIVNTGLFIYGCLCMWDTIALVAASWGLAGQSVFKVIVVYIVTYNFFFEFAINLLVAPGLHTVYNVVEKQFKRGRR